MLWCGIQEDLPVDGIHGGIHKGILPTSTLGPLPHDLFDISSCVL